MAVLGHREVLPRTYEHKLGGQPSASRVFIATVNEPTPSQVVLDAIGIKHSSIHPEHSFLECDGFSVDEIDRHHVQCSYTYSLKQTDIEGGELPPWLEPDQWAFSTGSSSVALTQYYDVKPAGMDWIGAPGPLMNTAGDVITGLTYSNAEVKMTISGSRLTLDLLQLEQVTNAINSEEWLVFGKHCVQCVGVSASPDRLVWNNQALEYWRINTELVYRSEGFDLYLPNVGWNVIVGGKRRRAWTFVDEDGVRVRVPSPEKVSLNFAGGPLCGEEGDSIPTSYGGYGDSAGACPPEIYRYQIYHDLNFADWFSSPPPSVVFGRFQ